jgi:microcystin-dependent protein
MWSGSIASIPSGWVLCDGTNSTPDLRNRFIVGAGSTYAVAATGGSADATLVSHNHTATSSVTDPGHNHTIVSSFASVGTSNIPSRSNNDGAQASQTTSTATTGITVATTVASAGSSATNANLPPYYALAYIMKA